MFLEETIVLQKEQMDHFPQHEVSTSSAGQSYILVSESEWCQNSDLTVMLEPQI